ncbi:bacteriocin immunity protein [Pseudomonas sp. B26(2017)]|uniref:bacteriocin immunity protein n=1 Tax=Pseudomonas sp. B26(2017) TaxID=1981732 RepID=UPI000A1DC9A0|nr:bacteriocin immunity protein [Pseudomonas sp. B26(2017)]
MKIYEKTISDYTEAEFIEFLNSVLAANTRPDEILHPLIFEFERLSEHPAGSDLIYWPKDGAQCTPEGITETVKKWRATNGLPGF